LNIDEHPAASQQMALRDVPLRRADLVVIGGKADMKGCIASAAWVEFDPM